MKKEEIHFADWQRILLGETPPIFLLEVFVRALITYVLLLVVVSWLGKRMSGQLTIMEMAVMITLGAIVSVPMQTPDRGILQGLLLLLCAVGFQRGISYLGYRSHGIENITQGKPNTLVKDGLLDLKQMAVEKVSRQQLFAELRGQQIYNLGMVERIYLEACGLLSVYTYPEPRPGLPLYPPYDQSLDADDLPAAKKTHDYQACSNCGNVRKANATGKCSICNQDQFTFAVI